jgi:hypothetical protein
METILISDAQSVVDWSAKILKDTQLTELQRDDLQAIQTAAERFIEYANSEIEVIRDGASPEKLHRIRHDLRNHLNIINGFSRLFVKQLPDNLLLHMMNIRNIHTTSQKMIEQVDNIR